MSPLLANGLRYAVENGMKCGTACASLISILIVYLVLSRSGRGDIIRTIRGPPSPSWIFGHMLQLLLSPTYGDYEFDWLKLYGSVYLLKGCFGQNRLMVSDPMSLKYILNSQHFGFGPNMERIVHLVHGPKAIMAVNEEDHKRFRTALNVGFTAAAVRNYLPVLEKAAQTLTEQLDDASEGPLNVCPIVGLATLGAIGEVLIGYPVQELGVEFIKNSFQLVALSANQSSGHILADYIGAHLPTWVWRAAINLPTRTLNLIRTMKLLADELGARAVREKKEAARHRLEIDTDLFGRLCELFNVTRGITGLMEDEIVAQTGIIMAAGQDTTANTLVFGLLELARAPGLQDKLRAEIHSTLGDSAADSIAYDSMPFLNAFIKECLRMYPAEAIGERMTIQDTTIPLTDAITTIAGENISQIPVRKGQIVYLGISSYHRHKARWGKHPHEFNPTRWLDGSVHNGDGIGLYANLLSFMGGPRACLGWRFALLEMQVFVCELVGKFSFTLSENDPVHTVFATTLMPMLSDGQKGAPLCIKRIL
ncbi:cytochrome P450 [Mycena leptocephala]|nr:cytochrome P450 [Mycena leptocephala]